VASHAGVPYVGLASRKASLARKGSSAPTAPRSLIVVRLLRYPLTFYRLILAVIILTREQIGLFMLY
jgi:hypothetical protein